MDNNEFSVDDKSSPSFDKPVKMCNVGSFDQTVSKNEDIFELGKTPNTLIIFIFDDNFFTIDEEKESENQMKSLIEHLELNIASDLPFNASAAEEALDATLAENIEQLKSLEVSISYH